MFKNPLSDKGSPILAAAVISCSPPRPFSAVIQVPCVTWNSTPSELSLRIKFITPAIASEPYCADAPSRKTSSLLTAMLGIIPTSTAWAPTFMAAPKCEIRAER